MSQLKDRQLHHALGSKGVEGETDDDWQCVDCHRFLVHLLLPGEQKPSFCGVHLKFFCLLAEARKHLDLESHWTAEERPAVEFNHDPAVYEQNFVRMLERFPCPEDYIKAPEMKTREPVDVMGKL